MDFGTVRVIIILCIEDRVSMFRFKKGWNAGLLFQESFTLFLKILAQFTDYTKCCGEGNTYMIWHC